MTPLLKFEDDGTGIVSVRGAVGQVKWFPDLHEAEPMVAPKGLSFIVRKAACISTRLSIKEAIP